MRFLLGFLLLLISTSAFAQKEAIIFKLTGSTNLKLTLPKTAERVELFAGQLVVPEKGKQRVILGQDAVLEPGETKTLRFFCIDEDKPFTTKAKNLSFSDEVPFSEKRMKRLLKYAKLKDQEEAQKLIWDDIAYGPQPMPKWKNPNFPNGVPPDP